MNKYPNQGYRQHHNGQQNPHAMVPVNGQNLPDVKIHDGRMNPESLDQLYRLSTIVAQSGLAPKDMQTPERIFVAAQLGMEMGLSFMQSIQNIAVINGRPSIWGDAMFGLIQASNTLVEWDEHYEGNYPDPTFKAVCKAKRKGRDYLYENEFSIQEARDAGLMGKDTWRKYTKRMLKMRARSLTLRDGWADILKGLHSAEELVDGDVIEMSGDNGRYAPAQEDNAAPVERPVYRTQSVKDLEGGDEPGEASEPAEAKPAKTASSDVGKPEAPGPSAYEFDKDAAYDFSMLENGATSQNDNSQQAHDVDIQSVNGFSVGDIAYYLKVARKKQYCPSRPINTELEGSCGCQSLL